MDEGAFPRLSPVLLSSESHFLRGRTFLPFQTAAKLPTVASPLTKIERLPSIEICLGHSTADSARLHEWRSALTSALVDVHRLLLRSDLCGRSPFGFQYGPSPHGLGFVPYPDFPRLVFQRVSITYQTACPGCKAPPLVNPFVQTPAYEHCRSYFFIGIDPLLSVTKDRGPTVPLHIALACEGDPRHCHPLKSDVYLSPSLLRRRCTCSGGLTVPPAKE